MHYQLRMQQCVYSFVIFVLSFKKKKIMPFNYVKHMLSLSQQLLRHKKCEARKFLRQGRPCDNIIQECKTDFFFFIICK